MKEKFKKLLMSQDKIVRITLFISFNIVLISVVYAIIKLEVFGKYTILLSLLFLIFAQSLIIKLINEHVMNKEYDASELINNKMYINNEYVSLYKKNNEYNIDNKLRLLKEEIDSEILQKLSEKTDTDLEYKLKKHLDEKLDINIVETLGERVQSVSSDFALAKRLSGIVEQGHARAERLNSGYHDIYERFLKSYRFFGIAFALIGVGVPSICLLFHISHIINNDIEFIKNFNYQIYLPIIPFTFLCVSLSIIMFSLSAKAQEKIESYTKELNTLLMKATGARLLIETADKEQMIKAGEKFMEVERNFVLKKGERTIEQGNNELNTSLSEKQYNMMMNFITAYQKSKKDT